ncbi:DUF5979 domain-containing protein [Sanguibacter sp. Leaf3]|uniref:DUF5979 domain-containing protein n=1 Tax=Sanguibacter sp. Leaf3 TaxID=1736209 RepID=UPI000A669758|nr:DUF5979 domain-containing protein [Sanguibacter sp. Leaf3]
MPHPSTPLPGLSVRPTQDGRGRRRARTVAVSIMLALVGLTLPPVAAVAADEPAVSQTLAPSPAPAPAPSTTTDETGTAPEGAVDTQSADEPAPAATEAEAPGTTEGTEGTEGTDSTDAPAQRQGAVTAADLPTSQVNVTKTNDVVGALTPGKEFTYQITVKCSGLTVDCVDETVTDVLPAGLDVTSLPPSTPSRTVTYDETTRELTVQFVDALQEPVGEKGLTAGSAVNLTIGMRLPADTTLLDGSTVSNTATVVAENAEPHSSTSDLVVSVPRVVTPVATKRWDSPANVAGTGSTSTIVLGVRNTSSTSAEVTELSVSDSTPATFEHFDLTDATLLALPAGATTAQLFVVVDGAEVPAGQLTAPGAFDLPVGVDATAVTGARIAFTAGGAALPYDATGGSVSLDMVLRDTLRSTGEPLRPSSRIIVDNCAVPGAVDAVAGPSAGTQVCASTQILPDTLVLGATKDYFPDTDASYTEDTGEHAVIGHDSPVTAIVSITNRSPFKIAEIVVREPHSAPVGSPDASELEKLDVSQVRWVLPQGGTSAQVLVTYADGTMTEQTYTADGSAPTAAGKRVTGVTITYTGRDADGNASIAEGATARLGIHGTLNDLVTDDDLADGTSPFVLNVAGYTGSAGRTDSTGTTSGTVSGHLEVETANPSLGGTKTVGQTSVPEDQPIPFTLRVVNNGNIALVSPVVSDPRTEPDGTPVAAGNPFDSLRLTSASVDKSASTPGVTIEVYDPVTAAWGAYTGVAADVLERATGVRARMDGELTPTKGFTLNLRTERRPGVPDGVVITNCYTPTAGGYVGTEACSPQIETGPANDAGSLNKSIAPATLPEWVPGLSQQTATVTLTARNTGNMSMKSLQMTDEDPDFFDAVDFRTFTGLRMPAGADRVQVDAFSGGAWVTGTPRTTAVLPNGVSAASVTGLRATFTLTSTVNDGYMLTPCEDTMCSGRLLFTVSPRQHPRSDATAEVPATLTNTVSARYHTFLNPVSGDPREIDPVDATLALVEGTSSMAVSKTPNSSIEPGEVAPFRLTVRNTGTSNISDLVVKDLLPVGLELDESFAGYGGQPFKVVDVTVPAGTPPVPAPVFTATPDGERTAGLAWDFSTSADGQPWVLAPSARLTIEIQVRLEPGVTTNQVITNTMGATGTGPSFTCDAASQTDGAFGPGTYCTASAGVTVKGGAAFSARKWVAGTVDLGWYNTRTKTAVAVGGPQCPSRVGPDGVVYTAFPCIALVNPGDQFQYLLRLVNAGTESATNMRIVDRFPVQGDTGVILDQSRGTQWTTRPTLATEPVLSGPGAMTTRYTTESTICTSDLDMGGAGSSAPQCAGSEWAAPFSPDVTAASMDLTFATPLVPGGAVDITFAMTSPVDATEVANPSVAWNSFAHAETTQRGGGSYVLPSTEPIQVGVGLMFGSLEISKEIGENPYGLALDDVDFGVRVVCTVDPVGGDVTTVRDETLSVSVDTPVRVDGIPSGAECAVWETDPRGGAGDATEADPFRVTIPADPTSTTAPQQVRITNDFSTTRLALVKDVVGKAAPYAQTTYPAAVTCTYGGAPVAGFDPLQVTVSSLEPTVVDVPSGAECSVLETDAGGASKVTYGEDATDDVSRPTPTAVGEVATLAIVNEFRAGSLVVAKDFTGPGADGLSAGPFTFSVVCSLDGRADVVSSELVVSGDGSGTTLYSEPLDGLPVGAECVVTETGTGGADTAPAPVTVTIPDAVEGLEQTVVAGFTNVFSAATLDLTKVVDGDAADSEAVRDAEFTVLVTCQVEASDGTILTIGSASTQIRGGETLRLVDAEGADLLLPNGAHCFAAETETGGATTVTIDADSYETAVVVGTSDEVQEIGLTVVNTFTTPPEPVEPTGPTDPSVDPSTPTGPGSTPGDGGVPAAAGGLPVTGADVVWISVVALLLVSAGAVLVVRRRRTADARGETQG